jgi:hypothetical protein
LWLTLNSRGIVLPDLIAHYKIVSVSPSITTLINPSVLPISRAVPLSDIGRLPTFIGLPVLRASASLSTRCHHLWWRRRFHANLEQMLRTAYGEANSIALCVFNCIRASQPDQPRRLATGRTAQDVRLGIPHRFRMDAVGLPMARDARWTSHNNHGIPLGNLNE